MRRSAAQIRREASALRAEVLAELQKPCFSVSTRMVLPSGEVAWVPNNDPGDRTTTTKVKGPHVCTSKCLSVLIGLIGADPDKPDFPGELAKEIAGWVDYVRHQGLKPWIRGALEEMQRKAAFYGQPFPQEAVDALAGELPLLPPRVDEPQAQAPALIPARPETPARNVIVGMRPVLPTLPAPPADCVCGHGAQVHREVFREADCARCGLPDQDHAHAGVLVLSGPPPCVFTHPFPGCTAVPVGATPCRCLAYRTKEAA